MQNRAQEHNIILNICLFGAFCATDSEGNTVTLPGRKDRALLAYLAVQADRTIARDRLVELLWPSAAEGSGRASLRQALSTIRKALPEEARVALVTDRDTVCLASNNISTDLNALEQAQLGSAELRLSEFSYDGAFLDGLSSISPEFDAWQAVEQTRATTLAIQALTTAAARAESEDRRADAVALLARIALLDPLAEAPVRGLMRAYVAQGRPEAALRQYRSLELLLETELKVQPEPKTQNLARQIRGKRSRQQPSEPAPLAPVSGTPLERPALLIAPFVENFESEDYFASSFTESVILSIARFPETPVFDLKTVKAANSAHAEEPLDMARAIGAKYVLSGTIRRIADRIRINTRLTDAESAQTVWAEKFDSEIVDILEVEDDLSARVATAIAGRIEDEGQRRARAKKGSDLDVLDWVMRGRYNLNLYTKSGEEEAKQCFEEALRRDPECVAALAGLAISHLHDFESTSPNVSQNKVEIAQELAERAIALDENDAHARYAMASSMCYLGGHELALQHCNRALEINPNDYHNICTLGWILTFKGDISEGIECNSRAISLNPYAPSGCLMISGFGQILQGEYEKAIKTLLAIRAENMFKQAGLAACYKKLGQAREAELAAKAFRNLAEQDFPGDTARGFEHTKQYWRRIFRFARKEDADCFFGALNAASIPV